MASDPIGTRLATPADAPAIAAIYNEGIADRVATFETEPRTAAQLEAQLATRATAIPPWSPSATAGSWPGPRRAPTGAGRPMPASPSTRCTWRARRGARARAARRWRRCAAPMRSAGSGSSCRRIFPENVASLALHERCGFRVVGVYRRHGKLEGAWRDCVIVERMLDESRIPR